VALLTQASLSFLRPQKSSISASLAGTTFSTGPSASSVAFAAPVPTRNVLERAKVLEFSTSATLSVSLVLVWVRSVFPLSSPRGSPLSVRWSSFSVYIASHCRLGRLPERQTPPLLLPPRPLLLLSKGFPRPRRGLNGQRPR
jgi:hypothetical protein